MDCHLFELRLEALLDGALLASERRECEAHADGCPRCRELRTLAAAAAGEGLAAASREALVADVLAQTSGPACEAAAARLAGALDVPLEATDRALLDLHVAGCAPCRQLAVTLQSLARDLPRLAEPAVDPRLVARVLAAPLPLDVRWRRWWATSWPAWVQRPRFAVEAAFVVTVVFLLLFEAAGSPLQALPRRALQATQHARLDAIEARAAALRGQTVLRLHADRLLPHARTTLGAGRRLASRLLRSGKAELGTIWQRAASSWQGGERPSTTRRDGRAAPNRK